MNEVVNKQDYECTIRRAPEGQSGWVSEYPDLPGCYAVGSTPDEAFTSGKAALSLWLERAKECGIRTPRPGVAQGATGHLRVRIPRSLHHDLAVLADDLDVSLNELSIQLAYRVMAKKFGNVASERLDEGCTGVWMPREIRHRQAKTRLNADRPFSGSWIQRVPKQLHQQLQSLAESEGVSGNLLLATILAGEAALVPHELALQRRTKEMAAA